jgi:hypothetical protein
MLSQKTKNNIMNEGHFYRLYYSDEYGTSKGLFLEFDIKQVNIEKYFNKLKCSFDTGTNNNIIEFIKSIEKTIVGLLPERSGKSPIYRIEEQLQNGFIKIFHNNAQVVPSKHATVKLLLKISGIWTSDKEYGVTFRFFFIRR